MKKKLRVFLTLTAAVVFLSGFGQARGLIKGVNLKLTFGYGNIAVGDLNTVPETWINNKVLDWNPEFREGEFNPFNTGTEMSVEFIINLTDSFGIGVGLESITRNENSLIWIHPTKSASLHKFSTYYDQAELTVFPVKFSMYYHLPVSSRVRLYGTGGIGYYSGKINNVHRDHEIYIRMVDLGIWGTSMVYERISMDYVIDAEDNAIGFHGGVGFEYSLSSHFFFFAEGLGRHVKLNDWVGEENWGDFFEKLGTLYYVEFDDGETYFYIWDEPPVFGSFFREAEISLSGLALRAGIKVKF